MNRLETIPVHSQEDIRSHFDRTARSYTEQHGDPVKLLKYRTDLIRSAGRIRSSDVVLDIGCGPGHHLLAMSGDLLEGVGIDFSSEMIAVAKKELKQSSSNGHIAFRLDTGEQLKTVPDRSVDVALCVGALEHMLDQPTVLKSAYRVLKPGGRFVCLTPNRKHLWFSGIAPALDMETRHLSTDKFLTRDELHVMLLKAGFERVSVECWSFIPKGDMHPLAGMGFQVADLIGRIFRLGVLRGGLLAAARKAQTDGQSSGSFLPTNSL